MMTTHEIIDVQLEAIFGDRFPWKIQRLVDEELNQGRWVEGYDLAVSQEVIRVAEAEQLLEIALSQQPELRIDRDALLQSVEECLPQSEIEKVLWIVDESGSYTLTDSLRVARFEGNELIWISPDISYDGIVFDSLVGGQLFGRAWLNYSDESPNSPFEFDFETGLLLKGKVVTRNA